LFWSVTVLLWQIDPPRNSLPLFCVRWKQFLDLFFGQLHRKRIPFLKTIVVENIGVAGSDDRRESRNLSLPTGHAHGWSRSRSLARASSTEAPLLARGNSGQIQGWGLPPGR